MSNTTSADLRLPAEGPSSRWEIPAAAGLSAVLLLGFFAVPVLGGLGVPFAAVPHVRLAFRRGLPAAAASGALAAGLVGALVLAREGAASALGLGAALIGLLLFPAVAASLVRRGVEPSRAFLWLAASGAVLADLVLLIRSPGGRSVGAELAAAFDAMIPGALDSYRRARMDPETLVRVEGTLRAARDFTTRYWAGLTAGCWVLSAAVNFYAGARTARPEPAASTVRFEGLRVHPLAAALFVAAGGAFAFLKGVGRTIAGDLLIALAALYFLAGLSIICHFARRWFRVRILRFGLYVLVAYFPMNVGVALLGLFDWYLNFRRRGGGAIET